MLKRFVQNVILRRFYEIALSTDERKLADSAIHDKYVPAISRAFIFSVLLIPSLLLLDTEIVVSILIPTTMVAGTAWFAISLATMKQKFEDFGTELTTDLFVAFTLSLMMLFLAALASLTMEFWEPCIPDIVEIIGGETLAKAIAAGLAMVVIGKLVFSIFTGSLKYDINDAMLAGQNEAAQRFFENSLSLLHSTSELLKSGKALDVANYSIGLAFYEIFSVIRTKEMTTREDMDDLFDKADDLIKNPGMGQKDADRIAMELIRSFLRSFNPDLPELHAHKSFIAIQVELECLKSNDGETQFMTDTRFSVIFEEMSNLLDEFGNTLFPQKAAPKEDSS
uniref:Uncharacterized protein n=1 Tax=Candidatus Kentrum sp. SD TaxID=2126332 RepID=A0A450YH93_9GAMM|nr:MAG: hypothetical protein BECKSD772F_GA0070984_107718 [Candidatus Kentron sp. SD]VFK47322.1 MAG: hypothetical protein BECKSD772E_GA0070983_10932 [Candidatus Kentron sp. SD]